VFEASLQTRVRSQAVTTGGPIGRHTPPPGLGEGLPRGELYLAYQALVTDSGHQLKGVFCNTLVQLASRLSGRVLRSTVWQVMSTFASRAHWGVAAMRQDRNWGEKGVNYNHKISV
jgi:hypothetical protein